MPPASKISSTLLTNEVGGAFFLKLACSRLANAFTPLILFIASALVLPVSANSFSTVALFFASGFDQCFLPALSLPYALGH